jgi:hypothetical protein
VEHWVTLGAAWQDSLEISMQDPIVSMMQLHQDGFSPAIAGLSPHDFRRGRFLLPSQGRVNKP